MQMQNSSLHCCRSSFRRTHSSATACRASKRLLANTAAAASSATVLPLKTQQKRRLLYDGIIFDMDGTLTEAHIDFADMRARTGIPVGDLFVAMESWEEPERIKQSMDVILEIEAEAAKTVTAKEGLVELLAMLRDSEVQVGLVTRNTTSSVNAFFQLIEAECRSLFSEVRTREFRYVKPDKRLLLDVAQAWQLHPGRLLMVGDSFEDVEVGNAAGTATCLIAGGGNEAPGTNMGPPAGAIPTLTVSSLTQLQDLLLKTAPATDIAGLANSSNSSSIDVQGSSSSSSSLGLLGWSIRSTMSESESDDEDLGLLLLDPTAPGNPAPGLDFVDFLVQEGAITTATCSFPRMGAAAGGLQACPEGGGDRVLHVGCGDGALAKMLASKGLVVVGVDRDITAGLKRGLKCVQFEGQPFDEGSLASVAAVAGTVDAVLIYSAAPGASGISSSQCLTPAALQEYKTVLSSSGRLCIDVPLSSGSTADGVNSELAAAGYAVTALQVLPAAAGSQRLRLIACMQ